MLEKGEGVGWGGVLGRVGIWPKAIGKQLFFHMISLCECLGMQKYVTRLRVCMGRIEVGFEIFPIQPNLIHLGNYQMEPT